MNSNLDESYDDHSRKKIPDRTKKTQKGIKWRPVTFVQGKITRLLETCVLVSRARFRILHTLNAEDKRSRHCEW
jgi:hypothetical protein